MKKGIDVSEWQEVIDWKKVKGNIGFVILREGYRKKADKYFFENVKGCRDNQIPIHGVYHFIYATTNQEVLEEAQSCLENIEKAGLTKNCIVWVDLEYDSVKKAKDKGVTIGKNECDLFSATFCEFFSVRGYKTGIYTNLDYHKSMYYPDTLAKYPIWLADYSGGADKPCLYHQYSSKGSVPGIKGNVDMNYYFDEKEEGFEMSKIETATQWMESHANDNAHGYDQLYRWGEKGDFDCSSAVITAWQSAGVPVKSSGATYTGNMYSVFTRCGFVDVTKSVNLSTGAGLQRGDVLLNHVHHVAMYVGYGMEVEASINEKGKATGGKPGDQTGKEFLVRSYRNYPWNCVLRYPESVEKKAQKAMDELDDGVTGNVLVKAGQEHSHNYTGHKIVANGLKDDANRKQKVKVLQTGLNLDYNSGLVVDGICGTKTIKALGQHYVELSEVQHMVTACEILLYMNGYNPNGVESPGHFGGGCEGAVKQFQSDNGLPVTGICGAKTFLALIA